MSTEEIISEFISKNKTLIVAPAGYGKTYTIVECIQQLPNNTKSLILTHTHAGIASIKAKLKDKRIDPKKYQVETITSYAQKYVKSYCLEKLPDIENSKQYWEFVLEKSVDLFKNSHIQRVINLSYNHLFVDEYQDCSKKQHQMILALSEILPTHILGDPLQGIIDFNHDLVDFETDIFPIFDKQELKEPYRWIHYGSKELGEYLRTTRNVLYENFSQHQKNTINLTNINIPNIKVIETSIDISASDFYRNSPYKRRLIEILNSNNKQSLLLLIMDKGGNSEQRARFLNNLGVHNIVFLEAIDDKIFYNMAKEIDSLIDMTKASADINTRKILKENILEKFFNKTELKNWIKVDGVIIRKGENKIFSDKLKILYEGFIKTPNIFTLNKVLAFLKNDLKLKSSRPSLILAFLSAFNTDDINVSAYRAISSQRNKIRRLGRKVDSKCFGTTALTKGLEFETVVILDAHKFKCPKNLYVALTRATKELIIFTKELVLKPYND